MVNPSQSDFLYRVEVTTGTDTIFVLFTEDMNQTISPVIADFTLRQNGTPFNTITSAGWSQAREIIINTDIPIFDLTGLTIDYAPTGPRIENLSGIGQASFLSEPIVEA